MGLPKILVFTPVYEGKDYCLDEFIESAMKLTYPNKRHILIDNSENESYYLSLKERLKDKPFEVYRVSRGNNSREALARAQNFARKIAIEENYNYLFSLESDIFTPPNIIEALLVQGKRVISGLYFIGPREEGVRVPCLTLPVWLEDKGYFGSRLLKPEEFFSYLNKGIKQVQAAGMGCCLMHRSTFELVPFTYDPRYKGHSDIYFFNDMFRRKISVWVDTDLVCDHKNSDWTKVKDR